MDEKELTKDEVFSVLAAYFEWSTKYIRAAREGNTSEMVKLDREFNAVDMVRNVLGESDDR